MNKQILKLAKKSGATLNEGFDGDKNFVYGISMSPEELEKFAESIVRECAEIARLNTRVDSKVYLMIQEHFGVES